MTARAAITLAITTVAFQLASPAKAYGVHWPVTRIALDGASGAWVEHSGTVDQNAVTVDLKFDQSTNIAELVKTLNISDQRFQIDIEAELVQITFEGRGQGDIQVRYYDPNITSTTSYSVDLDIDPDGNGKRDGSRISHVTTIRNDSKNAWKDTVKISDGSFSRPAFVAGAIAAGKTVSYQRSQIDVAKLISSHSFNSNHTGDRHTAHPARKINLAANWPSNLRQPGQIAFRDRGDQLRTEAVSQFAQVTGNDSYQLPDDRSVVIAVIRTDGISGTVWRDSRLAYTEVKVTTYNISNAHEHEITPEIEHHCHSEFTLPAGRKCDKDGILKLTPKVRHSSTHVERVQETAVRNIPMAIPHTVSTLTVAEETEDKLQTLHGKLPKNDPALATSRQVVENLQSSIGRLIRGLKLDECIREQLIATKSAIAASERPAGVSFSDHLKNVGIRLNGLRQTEQNLYQLRAKLVDVYNSVMEGKKTSPDLQSAVSAIDTFACSPAVGACHCQDIK